MKQECNQSRAGLSLGILFAIMHGLWAVSVGLGIAKGIVDWLLNMHFIGRPYTLLPFSLTTGIIGIIIAFITGYVIGYVFAYLYNWAAKFI